MLLIESIQQFGFYMTLQERSGGLPLCLTSEHSFILLKTERSG